MSYLDEWLLETESGNLYEYIGSTGKEAAFADINDGSTIYVKLGQLKDWFVDIWRRD